jgi:hypothetical protein
MWIAQMSEHLPDALLQDALDRQDRQFVPEAAL